MSKVPVLNCPNLVGDHHSCTKFQARYAEDRRRPAVMNYWTKTERENINYNLQVVVTFLYLPFG